MADIELVIKIDEDIYKSRKRKVNNPKRMVDEIELAIANGTPLEQEPTTKNDLGVDCISRDEVCRYVAEFVNHEYSTKEEEELIDNIITGIEHMPSVTPQEPRNRNDLGVDCISREDAIKAMQEKANKLTNEDAINGLCGAVAILFDLPSVTPQETRKGHWIADVDRWGDIVTTVNGYKCSECGTFNADNDNYCPNCGAMMVKPQESENKE